MNWCPFSTCPWALILQSPLPVSPQLTPLQQTCSSWQDGLEEMQEISAGFSTWFTYFWLKRKKRIAPESEKIKAEPGCECLQAEQQRCARLVRGPSQVSKNEDENPSFYHPWNISIFILKDLLLGTHTLCLGPLANWVMNTVSQITLNFCSRLGEILK